MTGCLMKWDHTQERIMPAYSCLMPHVPLRTPKLQFGSLPRRPQFFWERLDSFGNSSLWVNLSYNGNGERIWNRLRSGSLCITYNGSYMAEEFPTYFWRGYLFSACAQDNGYSCLLRNSLMQQAIILESSWGRNHTSDPPCSLGWSPTATPSCNPLLQ
jgi:hypothetical protein